MAESANRPKDIFLKALDSATPEERAAFVVQACGSDESLRRQVEAMLQAHATPDSFLEKPAAAMGLTVDELPRRPEERGSSEGPGTRIGPYKLLQQLGQGGMGVVFLAEQQEPVRRMVALKIIKQGMDSGQIVARFESERQALALMDHPNIARVLDAGTTDSGRPYFVMELIKGIAITRFCDQEQLTPRERLELFIPVCQAVQHAHQKGIIHRDLKPSNVLIALYDGKPVPKVIDFGVAKATSQKLTEKTLFTEVGSMVGTLEYMAPEQAELNNLDIDTRADIYALGVLLYELLTGSPPFTAKELRSNAFAEMLRIIREVEPPRPSTKLSSSQELPAIAASRKLEPGRLTSQVQGDLDWIVMKCLEKDRGRRYETANAVVQDIQRYLTDEPVQAGPPGAGYRLRKFFKRNRGTVTAAAIVLTTLLAGIAGTSWGWVEALWQRDDAMQARKDEADQRTTAVKAISDARDAQAAKAKAEGVARAAAEDKADAEQGKAAAEAKARAAADQQAQAAKGQARFLEASLALERGTNHCANGEYARGLLRLVRGLEVAPEDAEELQQSLRSLLSGWANQLHPLQTVLQHEGSVWDAVLSPDGKTVATKSSKSVWDEGNQPWWPARGKWFPEKEDAILQLWDAVTGKRIGQALVGHRGDVHVMVFSPDSKVLVTGGQDKTARRWDAASGRPIGTVLNHRDPVLTAVFSTDGKTLVTGGVKKGAGEARLWNAATGALVREIQPNEAEFNKILSADAKIAGSIMQDGVRVPAPAYHPATQRVLTPGPDHTVRVWEADKLLGAPIRLSGLVRDAAFSADGKTILTVTGQTACLWETDPNPPLWECEIPQGHEGYPPGILVAVSPDGRTVVTGGGKHVGGSARLEASVAHLRHAASGKIFGKPLQCGGIRNLAFSPDGKSVLTLDGKEVQLWDAHTGEPQGQLLDPNGVDCARVSPDGKVIATGTYRGPPGGGELRFWDRATGKPLGEPLLQQWPVVDVVFSPDSRTLLSRTGGNSSASEVQLWDVATRKALPFSLPSTPRIHAVAFSPDGKVVLTGAARGFGTSCRCQMWDPATGKPVGAPLPHPHRGEYVFSVAFWPDGQTILTCSADGTVRLWDRASGKVRAELFFAGARLSLSSHGQLVTLPRGGGVQQWDATTVKPVGRPLLPGVGVEGVVMDPDGKILFAVTGTGNQLKLQAWRMPSRFAKEPVERIRLWVEWQTGQELNAVDVLEDLDTSAWRQRWDRLQKLGGPPTP